MIKDLNIRWSYLSRSRYILAARYLINRIGLKYVKGIVYGRPLNIELAEVATVLPISVKLVSIDDINNKKYLRTKLSSGDDLVKHQETVDRLNSGDMCFIAELDNTIVGFSWLSFNRIKYENAYEREITLNEDEALIYDRMVFRGFRMSGVSNKLNEEQLNFLRINNYKKSLVIIRSDNIPSIKSFEKFGFYPEKYLICLRIFWFKKTFERLIR